MCTTGSLASSSLARRSQSQWQGRDRTGAPYRYEIRDLLNCTQEKQCVMTDPRSTRFEPCISQAAVQDVDTKMHFQVHPSPRLVCSDRPEGRGGGGEPGCKGPFIAACSFN